MYVPTYYIDVYFLRKQKEMSTHYLYLISQKTLAGICDIIITINIKME